MSEGKAIYAALQAVQRDLKAPKGQYNSFGKYKYRSCEDIVEAVKPLLNDNGLILTMSDDVICVTDRVYIKATCKVIDVATGDSIESSAMAREALQKKGMDESQVTGTASSYARKYALNGLFAIDDTKDADTNEYRQTAQNGTGQARRASPSNYTNGTNKAAQNGDLMAKAKHSLKTEVERIGCTWDEVKAIAGLKIKKAEAKDMTVGEISSLAANLEKWIIEESQASK